MCTVFGCFTLRSGHVKAPSAIISLLSLPISWLCSWSYWIKLPVEVVAAGALVRCVQIVTSAIETQNVVTTCAGGELMKNMLPHLLEQLELCQKSLSAYLETKRAEFPRCVRM
jgi:hypothetical protein